MTAPVSLARGRAPLPPLEDRILPAIGLLLLALLAFTGIDTCAKWLVLHGLPATEAAFVRYAVHLAVVCAVGLAGAERLWRTANLGAVSVRAVALLGSTLLNFAALSFLPLTMTAAIMFSAPLWICLLSIPLLGEKVGRRRWAAMAVGFCGILVVARPWTGHLHPAILLSPRRRALRLALLDPDPHARRPRPDQHPAVLRRPRRHPRRRPLRPRRLDLADRRRRAGSPSPPSASSAGPATSSSPSPTVSRPPRRSRPSTTPRSSI